MLLLVPTFSLDLDFVISSKTVLALRDFLFPLDTPLCSVLIKSLRDCSYTPDHKAFHTHSESLPTLPLQVSNVRRQWIFTEHRPQRLPIRPGEPVLRIAILSRMFNGQTLSRHHMALCRLRQWAHRQRSNRWHRQNSFTQEESIRKRSRSHG